MIDKKAIWERFDELLKNLSWESWSTFEKRHFSPLSDAPTKSAEDFARQERRAPIVVNGVLWKPVRSADIVDKELKFLSWKLLDIAFAHLEPEAAAENATHPERYDKFCVYCEIRTDARSLLTCPICEHELLDFPLNDIDDDCSQLVF